MKVTYPEMSQLHSLQCLFCQQLNPSDADYCNSCDGQLNLQPCVHCDAVDLRTATHCYKCGAAFSLPAAPGLGLLRTPAIVGRESSAPTATNPAASDTEPEQHDALRTYSHSERQPLEESPSPARSATAANSRRGAPAAILGILLLLITASVAFYLYRGHTPQAARTQIQNQAVQDVPGARKPEESAPSQGAAGMDAALKPMDPVQTPPSRLNPPVKTPSPTPPGADAARAARPLPGTDGGTKAVQDLSVDEKCPPAVATLGLCNPDTQQEKP